MENVLQVIGIKEVEACVMELRGQKVLLDVDVAELYGVETKRVNEAVKNNPEKFPEGYIIELNSREIQTLRSNLSTTNISSKTRVAPKAFSEKALYMIATILKSPRATQTSIAIIDAFAKLRELVRNIDAIHNEPDNAKQKNLIQRTGELLSDLLVDDKETTETESTIELNLMAVKFKHTVKRTRKNKANQE